MKNIFLLAILLCSFFIVPGAGVFTEDRELLPVPLVPISRIPADSVQALSVPD